MSLPTRIENPKGLHGRFLLEKLKGYEMLRQTTIIGDNNIMRDVECWDEVSIEDAALLSPNAVLRPVFEPVDDNAEYFVLRLDEGGRDINHIKACRIGIHAYADAIEAHIPQLAQDLRERYPLL